MDTTCIDHVQIPFCATEDRGLGRLCTPVLDVFDETLGADLETPVCQVFPPHRLSTVPKRMDAGPDEGKARKVGLACAADRRKFPDSGRSAIDQMRVSDRKIPAKFFYKEPVCDCDA
jgi:hypothetical protein